MTTGIFRGSPACVAFFVERYGYECEYAEHYQQQGVGAEDEVAEGSRLLLGQAVYAEGEDCGPLPRADTAVGGYAHRYACHNPCDECRRYAVMLHNGGCEWEGVEHYVVLQEVAAP